MKKILFLFLLLKNLLPAQTVQGRIFGTQQYMNQIRLSDTSYIKNAADIERFTLDFKQNGSMSEVTIPVVFHVVYSSQASPITLEDIKAQVNQLNIDFNTPSNPYTSDSRYSIDGHEEELTYLHPADRYEHFAARAARPMIKFCFPQFDPQGNHTTGVLFVPSQTSVWNIGNGIKQSELGGSTPWDPQAYCNIWVTDLSDKTAGFAQMPGGQTTTDGIVIDQQYFRRADGSVSPLLGGNDFALGKTLVHLMGSYLNLYELWNDYIYCADDLVDDTPIHNAPNYGKSEYRHVTTCDGNAVEMTMNLMDSGCDSTMYMFTWGQVARMQATLALGGPRYGLTQTPIGCATPGLNSPDDRSASSTLNRLPLQVKAIPNPNPGNFTVQIQSGDETTSEVNVQVFNQSGMLIYQTKNMLVPSTLLSIPIYGSEWPTGIYRIRVIAGQQTQIKQVVINH